jgi:acyl dehydratase
MPMDLSWIGRELGPSPIAWSSDQCMLYALGVGAGVDEPQLTTENSEGVALRVLPTFATSLSRSGWGELDALSFGSYGAHQVVHAAQKIELRRPLPATGRALATLRIAGIWDKRVGALIELVTTAVDPISGLELFRSRTSLFVLGEGGFGGARGSALVGGPRPPRRPPDRSVVHLTHPTQALLFRLSGDHTPIHSDPAVAQRAGFERPILHGLCTFGFAARALLATVCAGDTARFRSMEGRFARPAYPGDTLVTEVWVGSESAFFETKNAHGESLIERGVVAFAKSQG